MRLHLLAFATLLGFLGLSEASHAQSIGCFGLYNRCYRTQPVDPGYRDYRPRRQWRQPFQYQRQYQRQQRNWGGYNQWNRQRNWSNRNWGGQQQHFYRQHRHW